MTKYESVVKDICLTTWRELQARRDPDALAEANGWVGVSCVIAFMKGVEPTPRAMVNHFGVLPDVVAIPMRRLIHHGVFTDRYNAKADKALMGQDVDLMTTKRAWCYIAGMASNFCGQAYYEEP